ncbi:hypothetical protein BDW22DRAFT_1347862 [Trametopsis cervina]|nr:hypothetical protein BDW22DRAFT_1347862 [Trametopsis cervina]
MAAVQALSLLLIFLCYVSLTCAQEFKIPSQWRVEYPRATSSLTITESSSFFAAAANGELVTNSTANRGVILDGLNTYLTWAPNGGVGGFGAANNDPVAWGVAAINAYRAYGDQQALQHAIAMWNATLKWYVTPEQASSGKHPAKNITISKQCGGFTTAGGVFSLPDADDLTVNGETQGPFIHLSASLYEITNDAKYLTAAELSAEFAINHMYNGIIITDTISLQDCGGNNPAITYNTGYVAAGLAVLSTLNNSWTPVLSDILSTAVPYSVWTNSTNGINYEGSTQPDNLDGTWPKGIFMRALWETWYRGHNAALNSYLEAYLLVQYNAILDLSTTFGSNIYSFNWQGPPQKTLNPAAQITVMDVFVAAVSFAQPAAAPSSSNTAGAASETPTPTPAPPGSSGSPGDTSAAAAGAHKKSHTGAIVGGVIAGVVGLALLVLALLFLRRRRQTQYPDHAADVMPVPYDGPMSEVSGSYGSPITDPSGTYASTHRYDKTAGSLSAFPHLEHSPMEAVPRPTLTHASSSVIESAGPEEPLSSPPALRPLPLTPEQARAQPSVSTDIANVPGLVDTLNRLLQRLPVGHGHGDEPPPSYGV